MLRVPFFLWTGLRNFTKGGYERAARSFDTTERDLEGQSIMVTGANSGIGLAAALELARRGSTLTMVCRSEERGRQAVEQVKEQTGNAVVHLEASPAPPARPPAAAHSPTRHAPLTPPSPASLQICDLSSLQSIRAFAKRYCASGRPLHCLVNNAGVLMNDGQRSVEGYDANFACNSLGTWALTRALEPALKRSAPSRVIFVTSGGSLTESLQVEGMAGGEGAPAVEGAVQYARDKRRQIAMAEWLSRVWAPAGVSAVSMHPGWTETPGVRTSLPGFHKAMQGRLRTPAQGADTIIWLCGQEAGALEAGALYLDRAPQAKHLPLSGTRYEAADGDRMAAALDALAAPALA
jgi:dehydrogenase/reductase SDR family protein 12